MSAQSTRRTEKSRADTPRPAAAPPQAERAAAPGALQRALADPAAASPDEILSLQRRVGNRAVSRLLAGGGRGETPPGQARVQFKLTVGPAGDEYEQEADRVAGEVMRMSEPAGASLPVEPDERPGPARRKPVSRAIGPAVRRAAEPAQETLQAQAAPPEVGLAGGEAGPEIESRLGASRGRGNPLPEATRSFMEPRFGADFSGVRVHTGGEAAQLNRQLGAQAFTHGSDIYMGPGKYDPGAQAGQQLLAHELTHVVQQGGALANKTQRKIEVSSAPRSDLVQGKWTDSIKNFGKSVVGAGKKASNKIRTLWGRADRSDQPAGTTNPILEGASAEEQSTYANLMHGSLAGSQPDFEDPALADQQPDHYKVTLAAAQEDVNWLTNVKDLKKVALKTAVTSPRQFAAGVQGNPEEYMARLVLTERGELAGKTESEQNALIQKFSGGIHDVGHTWVRLSTYVNGKLQKLWSYGFWPLKLPNPFTDQNEGGYAGFAKAGPGQVRHPDVAHEGDADKAYMDYDVKPKQFDKAMTKAAGRFASPPPYVLIGYNCTAFAREVLLAAGKSYPSNGLILPGVAYTPGGLYAAIMKESAKKGQTRAHTDDPHAETVKKVGQEAEERKEEAQGNVLEGYHLQKYPKPKPDAKRVFTRIFQGKTIRVGDRPNDKKRKRLKPMDIAQTMDVNAIQDKEFESIWEVVPLDFGPKIVYAHPKDLQEATKETKGQKPLDPARFPAGEYHIPDEGLTKQTTVKGATKPGGEPTSDVELFPGEKFHVFIEDELTTKYGQCRVVFFSTNYYVPIASLFDVEEEAEELPPEKKLPFEDHVITTMSVGADFDMLVQMGTVEMSTFKGLTPDQVAELAALLKRTPESVQTEIDDLS